MRNKKMIAGVLLAISITAALCIHFNRWVEVAQDAPPRTKTAISEKATESPVPASKRQPPVTHHGRSDSIQTQATASVARYASVAPVKKAPRPESELLPVEGTMLTANHLLAGRKISAMIQSDEYGAFVNELKKEAGGRDLPIDISELYGVELQHELSKYPDITLNDIACGQTICAVSVASSGQSPNLEAFKKEFFENTNAKPYGLFWADLSQDDGTVQRRIVFSTDPAVPAITMD